MITIRDYIIRHGVRPEYIYVKKDVILCPQCMKNPSSGGYSLYLGIRPCDECISGYKKQLESVKEMNTAVVSKDPRELKKMQAKYFKSLLQPYRPTKRGFMISKEFIELYPKRAREMWGREERRKAKYQFRHLAGWKDRFKSE